MSNSNVNKNILYSYDELKYIEGLRNLNKYFRFLNNNVSMNQVYEAVSLNSNSACNRLAKNIVNVLLSKENHTCVINDYRWSLIAIIKYRNKIIIDIKYNIYVNTSEKRLYVLLYEIVNMLLKQDYNLIIYHPRRRKRNQEFATHIQSRFQEIKIIFPETDVNINDINFHVLIRTRVKILDRGVLLIGNKLSIPNIGDEWSVFENRIEYIEKRSILNQEQLNLISSDIYEYVISYNNKNKKVTIKIFNGVIIIKIPQNADRILQILHEIINKCNQEKRKCIVCISETTGSNQDILVKSLFQIGCTLIRGEVVIYLEKLSSLITLCIYDRQLLIYNGTEMLVDVKYTRFKPQTLDPKWTITDGNHVIRIYQRINRDNQMNSEEKLEINRLKLVNRELNKVKKDKEKLENRERILGETEEIYSEKILANIEELSDSFNKRNNKKESYSKNSKGLQTHDINQKTECQLKKIEEPFDVYQLDRIYYGESERENDYIFKLIDEPNEEDYKWSDKSEELLSTFEL